MNAFVKLGLDSEVLDIVVVSTEDSQTEEDGINFLTKTTDYPHWIGVLEDEKALVTIGGTYNKERSMFVLPSPYPSWVLDENTLQWNAPIPLPDAEKGVLYDWNEYGKDWVEVTRLTKEIKE